MLPFLMLPFLGFSQKAKAKSKSITPNETGKAITIIVSYTAIECGCPQWFESKFQNVKFLEGVERFYLEPTRKALINANDLWDGKHMPLAVKITGRFSKEKASPILSYQRES